MALCYAGDYGYCKNWAPPHKNTVNRIGKLMGIKSSTCGEKKELNLNYSPANAKEQRLPTTNISLNHDKNTMHYCQWNINFTHEYNASAWQKQAVSSAYEQHFCQARSASALSILSAVAARKFLKGKEPLAYSYVKDTTRLSSNHACVMSSKCVCVCVAVGDRAMCVCVSERRKVRSDKATQRGRGTQDGETEEDREREKEEEQKMEAWMERCSLGFWWECVKVKNRKPFMSAWMAGPLPVTCWHISLYGQNLTHTMKGKPMSDCMNEVHAVLSNFSFFFLPWVECTRTRENLKSIEHQDLQHTSAILLTARKLRCHTISCNSNVLQ